MLHSNGRSYETENGQRYMVIDKGGHVSRIPVEGSKQPPKDGPNPLTAEDVDRIIYNAIKDFAQKLKG